MEMIKNFAVYVDGKPVAVTTNESRVEELVKKSTEKYPDSKITTSVWYD